MFTWKCVGVTNNIFAYVKRIASLQYILLLKPPHLILTPSPTTLLL